MHPRSYRAHSRRAGIHFAASAVGIYLSASLPAVRAAEIVILCTPQKSYKLAAAALQSALDDYRYAYVTIEFPPADKKAERTAALRKLTEAKPKLIAAAGATATMIALESVPDVPVIFFMVPNARDADFLEPTSPHKTRLAGVAADVSPDNLLRTIAKLDTSGKTIGLLHSPRTPLTVRTLAEEAGNVNLTIAAIQTDKDHFPDAIESLNAKGCDSVLMIPDGGVYNSVNVQRLLLWGIRQKKPVWAFSAGIVKAGALGGRFVSPEDVGQKAAEIVGEILAGAAPQQVGLRYPDRSPGGLNVRTAELIGLPIDESTPGSGFTRYGEDP